MAEKIKIGVCYSDAWGNFRIPILEDTKNIWFIEESFDKQWEYNPYMHTMRTINFLKKFAPSGVHPNFLLKPEQIDKVLEVMREKFMAWELLIEDSRKKLAEIIPKI